MATRNSFVLYTEYRDHIKLLTDEDKGKLLTAIFDYAAGEHPDVSGMAMMAFSFIRAQMDRDAASYEEKIAHRQNAGKRGGRPKKESSEDEEEPEEPEKTNGYFEKAKKANGFLGFQEKAKKANGFFEKQNNPVYVDVYVNDNVDVNVNDNVLNTHNNSVCAREEEEQEEIETERDADGSNARRSGKDTVYQSMTSTIISWFDAFWDAYPNQVGRNDALCEWNKLNITDQLFTQIMKGLESASKSREWADSNGRFIPYPANFLGKGLWKKKYDPADNRVPPDNAFTVMQGQEWDMDNLETRAINKALSL